MNKLTGLGVTSVLIVVTFLVAIFTTPTSIIPNIVTPTSTSGDKVSEILLPTRVVAVESNVPVSCTPCIPAFFAEGNSNE